jgi:tripartite ATP-independent transporter DctP family solute receptor
MSAPMSRRSALGVLAGAVTLPMALPSRVCAAQFRGRQFHNQPEGSVLHKSLVEMWAAVKTETQGRFEVETLADNGGVPGSDPEAVRMLVAGELEFFTVFGAPLALAVPIAEIQAVPFAFATREQAIAAADGRLGDYIRAEMTAKGIFGFPHGAFENGFRQITTRPRPIRTADDMAGLRIRTPQSQLFLDFFRTVGAEPRVVNFGQLYDALKRGEVDGQDNPVELTFTNRFYEVQKHVSPTNHMWSCFNLLANLKFWNRVPADVQAIIMRNVVSHVATQRQRQDELNHSLVPMLIERGMTFTEPDIASFRSRLGPLYARWKRHFGSRAWSLLEEHVGPIG